MNKAKEESQTYSINLDWLEIAFTGNLKKVDSDLVSGGILKPDYFIGDRILLRKKENRPSLGYKATFAIYIDGAAYAIMNYHSNGRFPFKYTNIIGIAIRNDALYCPDLEENLQLLISEMKLHFYRYSRIDIALDGIGLINRHNQLTKSKKFKRKKAIKIAMGYDDKNKVVNSYVLGSRKSDKYLTMYNKSKEIEQSGKSYIREFWVKNGLNPEFSVDRVEIRLKARALRNLVIGVDEIFSPDFLISFFKASTDSWLEFISIKDKKRRLKLVKWECFSIKKIFRIANIKKLSSGYQSVKTTLKTLFFEFIEHQQSGHPEVMAEIADEYGLMEWTKNKIPRWKTERQ